MQNRRSFLKGSVALTGISLLPSGLRAAGTTDPPSKLRIAHITDCHVNPTKKPVTNLSWVFKELNNMAEPPQLIINTGDTVMESNGQGEDIVAGNWRAWKEVTKENKIPIASCIGNHDAWTAPVNMESDFMSDNRYGKKWAIAELNMPARYYSFIMSGWKFIMLDSINRDEYSLDGEQFNWLEKQIADTNKNIHVCICSHVPIISAASLLYNVERRKISKVGFPMKDMHADVKKLKTLFHKHKNVKLCLSGHVHYIDCVDYLGVKYMCNGAVSGNWWNGDLDEFPPGYAIIDLFQNGHINATFKHYEL